MLKYKVNMMETEKHTQKDVCCQKVKIKAGSGVLRSETVGSFCKRETFKIVLLHKHKLVFPKKVAAEPKVTSKRLVLSRAASNLCVSPLKTNVIVPPVLTQ